jgi:nicotinamide-nucleotide amidase
MIPDDARLLKLAREVGVWLAARDEKLATAESCTAGWIAKCITDVPGSSEWFIAGIASYADEAKTALLGVPARLLKSDGAVSQAVVEAMARGAVERTGADRAVAVSGIAGPAGGTEEKPVGMVWFAWARREVEGAGEIEAEGEGEGKGRRKAPEIVLRTRVERFQGNRESIRRQAVGRALTGIMMV